MQIAAPTVPPVAPHGAADRGGTGPDLAALRAQAQELEAVFLSEMLGKAGVGAVSEAFGGGAGEEQFASFLRIEQARAMVRAGGIGLSESILRSLAGGADVE